MFGLTLLDGGADSQDLDWMNMLKLNKSRDSVSRHSPYAPQRRARAILKMADTLSATIPRVSRERTNCGQNGGFR